MNPTPKSPLLFLVPEAVPLELLWSNPLGLTCYEMLFISHISSKPEDVHQLRDLKGRCAKRKYHRLPQVCPSRWSQGCHIPLSNPPGDSNKPMFEFALNLHTMVSYHWNDIMNSSWLQYFSKFCKTSHRLALDNIANTVTCNPSFETARASSTVSILEKRRLRPRK